MLPAAARIRWRRWRTERVAGWGGEGGEGALAIDNRPGRHALKLVIHTAQVFHRFHVSCGFLARVGDEVGDVGASVVGVVLLIILLERARRIVGKLVDHPKEGVRVVERGELVASVGAC